MIETQITELFNRPFFELLDQARHTHKLNFPDGTIQRSELLSIKTGGCPEDCAYCPQSAHFSTSVEREPLMDIDTILAHAQKAKESGATRFCMGAAWRKPGKHFKKLLDIVKAINALGIETCLTAGTLTSEEAMELKEAGLLYYNHNIDTSRQYYEKIITTRSFDERLTTIKNIQEQGLKVCCGGIIGMGESRTDRIQFITELAKFTPHPESIPVNSLIRVPGTPLEYTPELDPFEFIRTIAVLRIVFPQSMIRLAAGRKNMDDSLQALCFYSGANSIFYGDKLLTAENATQDNDQLLLERLGLSTHVA